MPLAFTSRSHGTVAFGFFNITTDMLLLQRWFFFADQFCAAARALAAGGEGSETQLACWRIDDPADVGDLHGAIAGQVLSGFIGATYERWPFPAMPQDFKQDPDGDQTREEARSLIQPLSREQVLAVSWTEGTVQIGDMTFDLPDFAQLVGYVDRGGYPRWRDQRRPGYVVEMMEALSALGSPLLV